MDRKTVSYYVDIDTIFDTKLSVLRGVFPDFFREYMRYTDYWKRTSDNFVIHENLILDAQTFNIFYKRRNKEVLLNSNLTSIPYILCKQVVEHYKDMEGGRCLEEPVILINTFPYSFTEEEQQVFSSLFRNYLEEPPKVFYINLPYTELTLFKLAEYNVVSMIVNNGLLYLDSLDPKELVNVSIRNLKMITPKLLSKLKPIEEDFLTLSKVYEQVLDFEFLHSKFFSASLNPSEEELAEDFVKMVTTDEEFKHYMENIVIEKIKEEQGRVSST